MASQVAFCGEVVALYQGHASGPPSRSVPAGAEFRHTRATQAIKRGMRLDAIAAPLICARMANRVVTDEIRRCHREDRRRLRPDPELPARL
jgi:hypothetical protein